MFFYIIFFIAIDYHLNNFFHGDIKPANIFFDGIINDELIMTTDIGSLLYLGEPNDNGEKPSLFVATSFTE